METKTYVPSTNSGKNLLRGLLHRYLPYWPLFVLLGLFGVAAAYGYLHITPSVYEVSANLLIKDEKKGADDARILEALNIYSSAKIVDNETEVIQSKDLLRKVVDSLHLYASMNEDGPFTSRDAYITSPVILALKDPDRLRQPEWSKISFVYNKQNRLVTIAGKSYPLDTWVNTPFGVARFSTNPNQKTEPVRPLYFSLRLPNQVTDGISSNLAVSSSGKLSTVINLKLRDVVPERAINILNALIQNYNQAAVADKNILASTTLAFVEERIRFVTRELDSVENKLQAYRSRKGIVNLSEQGKLYLQNVGESDRMLTELNMQLAMLGEVQRYVQATRNNKVGIVPSIAGIKDPLTAQLLQKLYDSQIEYERLKKTIPVDHPTMVSLKNEIDNMRPTILENIQNQRLTLLASKNDLSIKAGTYASMLQTIPVKEKELLAINRQQAMKNDAYAFLVQKREEIGFAYAAAVPDSRMIEQPNAATGPVSPNRKFAYIVALSLGLLISIVIVNAKEFLSNKVLFRADIEALTTIPVIAEVIKLKGKQSNIMEATTGKSYVLAEQFRQLRARLGLYNRRQQYKKVLVTSSIAGEGKSFISNNLALSLAQSGKKVVLLDFDLRNPKITAWHNLTASKGLISFLENADQPAEEITYQADCSKLYVVPAGISLSTHTNPTELLINAELSKLFDYMTAKFDFVIVDTSPVDPVTDAYVLTKYCDTTLFVIRHDYTPKTMVGVLDENNKTMALKNIQIVFNGIKPRGFFSRKYGAEYGYGRTTIYNASSYQGHSAINT